RRSRPDRDHGARRQRRTRPRRNAARGLGAAMTTHAVEPWIEAPLARFVDDSRATIALLLLPSGQVLAQHGFFRAVDVSSACALAAAIHASGRELGKMLDGGPFTVMHH